MKTKLITALFFVMIFAGATVQPVKAGGSWLIPVIDYVLNGDWGDISIGDDGGGNTGSGGCTCNSWSVSPQTCSITVTDSSGRLIQVPGMEVVCRSGSTSCTPAGCSQ